MNVLLGLVIGGGGLGELLVTVVILAAVVALVFVALRQFGVTVPAWVVQCGWIVVCAVVVVFLIRFLFTL